MYEIAPGSILQRMFLKKRIKKIQKTLGKEKLRFCEIGAGKGANSNMLLGIGLEGIGYELNHDSCQHNISNNEVFIKEGRYQVRHANFFEVAETEKSYDIIFSCMVIEHFKEEEVKNYFEKGRTLLRDKGRFITLVPSSMKHWGIEDEIAGHIKRYSFKCFETIAADFNLKLLQNIGLTYPLSNILLPISNYLVERSEKDKEQLSLQKRTELSGNRAVILKTIYPWYFKVVLNEFNMYPFYVLQRIFKKNKNSLVIYNEMELTTPK